jgi:hypothetical protein
MSTSAPPAAEPKDRYDTQWTPGGHRLHVEHWPWGLTLMVVARGANLTTVQSFTNVLGQVAIPGASLQGQSMRLVRHFLSFFDDEKLIADGAAAVTKAFSGLTDAPAEAPAFPKPSGMSN